MADRLGLLVWTEIPNWVLLTDAADRRIKETFRSMVERDWNHPSIIIWTLVNENWGTDLARNPEHRRWLAEFYHEAKQIDPTRLIVDNSACQGNFHVAGDIEDYHPYRAIPDHADSWDAWSRAFASRQSDWIWAHDYLHERRPDLPLLVSEFGNWGCPTRRRFRKKAPIPVVRDGSRMGRWHRLSARHAAALHRSWAGCGFRNVGRLHARFPGAYGAQPALRDHHDAPAARHCRLHHHRVHRRALECNGLLTMQRKVKHSLDTIFTPLNQDNVVALRPQRWSGKPGESLAVEVRAFGVDGERNDGVIAWRAGDAHGQLNAPGGVITAPLVAPGMVTLEARWLADDGAAIANNQVELACVPASQFEGALAVIDDPALAATLRTLGYTVSETLPDDASTPVVARRYTKMLETAVQQGAHLLLLAGEPTPGDQESIRLPAGAVIAREGTPWQGDWATAFSWIKKQGPFATLPGSPLLEMEYAPVMPDYVLVGLPMWAYRTHSWAGWRWAGFTSRSHCWRRCPTARARWRSRPSSSTRRRWRKMRGAGDLARVLQLLD